MTRRTIILDTNLVVLLVVGTTGPKYLEAHKAVRSLFINGDFEVLQHAIAQSDGIKVSPHTLAEASNFLRQIADPYKTDIGRVFQAAIGQLSEEYIESAIAAARPEFLRHGLADMISLELASDNSVVLSTDGRLCHEIRRAGRVAVNFSQYREEYLEETREL